MLFNQKTPGIFREFFYASGSSREISCLPIPFRRGELIPVNSNSDNKVQVYNDLRQLFDASGNLLNVRINTTNVTTYYDTLALPVGCYKLVVDDKACNALQWWRPQARVTASCW